jgi:hypothetical protein
MGVAIGAIAVSMTDENKVSVAAVRSAESVMDAEVSTASVARRAGSAERAVSVTAAASVATDKVAESMGTIVPSVAATGTSAGMTLS